MENKVINHQEIDKQAAINAVLAEKAYTPPPENNEVQIHGQNFTVLKNVSYNNGFQATIYYNKDTNQIHGVIRGTEMEFSKEGAKDLLHTDIIGMGLLKHNPQINDAEKFAKLLIETANKEAEKRGDKITPKIVLAGHSLGGTHAQYLSHYLGDRVSQTFTYNAYGAASLGYNQRVPHTENVPVYNYRTHNDIVSGASAHYGKVFTYKIPSKEDVIGHGIGHFTDTSGNVHIFSPTAKQEGIVELEPNKHTWHEYATKGVRGFATYANPINVMDQLAYKVGFYQTPDAGKRADADGVLVYKADQMVKSAGQYMMEQNQSPLIQENRQPETLEKPETPRNEQPSNPLKNVNPEHSPQAQKLFQQYDEKFTALCERRGITADCKEDFENLRGAAVATALANGLPNIEKVDIDPNRVLWMGSYNPRPQVISISTDEAVNIPVSESMTKIQQTEQQHAQLAQERQISQNQSQQHSMSLA